MKLDPLGRISCRIGIVAFSYLALSLLIHRCCLLHTCEHVLWLRVCICYACRFIIVNMDYSCYTCGCIHGILLGFVGPCVS